LRDCPTDWADVQIRHLLNHTSGIPDLFGLLPEAPLLKTTAEVDRLLSEATSIPLDSPPGSEYAYSNFNYVLLGYVLREATGRDWETYLRERVLEPVGASDTEYDDVWAVVERKAHGYGFENGELRKIEYGDHSAYAAGGLLSTVDDLRRWQEALEAGRIVPVAVLDEMFTPHAGGYGYGWQIIRALGRELRNHTGGVDGYASHLAWYPDERLLIVLLSNVEGAPVKALACDVARIVLQDPVQPNTSAEWLSQGVGDRCDQEAL
jgi:CubicO group peptidase (beta-lactamase class C family)